MSYNNFTLVEERQKAPPPGSQSGPSSGPGAAGPLFVWKAPIFKSFESTKAAIAKMIKKVMHQHDLTVQKAAYGPLLKQPLPPTTCGTDDRPGWSPFFLKQDEIIDPEVYQSFRNLVSAKHENKEQSLPIYVPLQVSGAGKTKLCITLAMEFGAVIIRLNHFSNASAQLPIAQVVRQAYDIMCKVNEPKIQLAFFQGAQKMVDLWVLAYFHFLEDFSAWYTAQNFPRERLAEFFFRVVENVSFECIDKYLADITYLANPEHQSTYEDYKKQRLAFAVTNAPYIVFDDIVGMEGVLEGFFPHMSDLEDVIVEHQLYEIQTRKPAGEYLQKTNVMYALCAFADVVRMYHIKTILTGTKYSTIRSLEFGNTTSRGPARERAEYTLFPNPPNLCWPFGSKAEALQLFLHKFVSAPLDSAKLRGKLEYIAYIAESFFDSFLLVLERKMYESKPTTQNELVKVIVAAINGVKPTIQNRGEYNVQKFLHARDTNIEKKHKNMMQLYYAIVMHNGEVWFLKSDKQDAVAHNIAWLKSTNHGEYMSQVIAEPAVEEAILREFNLECSPDDSPVFQVLSDTVSPIVDRETYAKEVTAHVFQRYQKSLLDFIVETTQDPKKASRPTQGIPSGSILDRHKFFITKCGTYREFCQESQLYGMTHDNPGFVLFPGTSAKPDIKTLLREIDGNNAKLPCFSQVKNYTEKISLSLFLGDCLPSLDPENFFKGENLLHADWLRWWCGNQDYFDSYVRIVVSYSGFTAEVYDAVASYNATSGEKQPILLVHVPKQLLGNLAYNVILNTHQPTPQTQSKTLEGFNFSILPMSSSRFTTLMESKQSKATEDKNKKAGEQKPNTVAFSPIK